MRGGRGRARGRGERGGRGRAGRPVGLAHNLGRPRDDDDDDGERPAKRVQKVEDISSSGQESDSDDGPPLASTSKLIVVDDFVATKSVGLQIHPSRLATATREAVGEGDLSSTQTVQVVCRHWRKGNCATGKECPFLHEVNCSRPLSSHLLSALTQSTTCLAAYSDGTCFSPRAMPTRSSYCTLQPLRPS